MARLKEQLKEMLMADIIPGIIVLGVFFGSIWMFENYLSHLIR
jgi:hypothetical protein